MTVSEQGSQSQGPRLRAYEDIAQNTIRNLHPNVATGPLIMQVIVETKLDLPPEIDVENRDFGSRVSWLSPATIKQS